MINLATFTILLSAICSSCVEKPYNVFKGVIKVIEADCDYLSSNLNFDAPQSCAILISDEVIPLEISIFHNQVTSLNYFKDIDPDVVFDTLTMIDLRNRGDSTNRDLSLRVINKGDNFNLKAYFSEIQNGLVSCEIFPYNIEERDALYEQKAMFGSSIQYLFEIDEKGRIRDWIKKVVHNN